MKTVLVGCIFSTLLLGVLGQSLDLKLWEVNTPDLTEPSTSTHLPISYNYLQHWSNDGKPFEVPTCNLEVTEQTVLDYRYAVHNMSSPLYKKAAALSDGHFVFSPYSIWLTLAAVAEGCSGQTQQELFTFLHLPEDVCMRQKYYYLATQREYPSNDIVLDRKRLFIADSSIHVNQKWEDYVKAQAKLESISVPFKANPAVEIEKLKKALKVHLPHVDVSGNSIILESLDYHGLWTSAFNDVAVQKGPFYDGFGEQIGIVEYMKTTKLVNAAIIPHMNVKVVDLPVGRDGRYHMCFIVSLSPKENYGQMLQKFDNSFFVDIVANLKPSPVPVEIIIPKMTMTSELNVRQLLEELGLKSLWTDALATRNISEPAALPSAYNQRVTVTIDEGGVRPAIQEYKNFVPPLHTVYETPSTHTNTWPGVEYNSETSFVANKPFVFGLFDSETLTGLFTATFSKVDQLK